MRAHWIRAATLLCAAFIGTAAWAQATLTVSPPIGRPGLPVAVRGTAFSAFEAVDVYVNTTDTLLLVSTGEGAIAGTVPIAATLPPGTHYLTAIGRRSGIAAQVTYRVSTPWAQSGFGSAHTAFNPWENVLSPTSAPGLGVLWSADTNSNGRTAAVSNGRIYVPTQGQGLVALSTTDGSVQWQALPGLSLCAAPAVTGNTVYVSTCLDSTVYAVNTLNGAVRWSRAVGGTSVSAITQAKGIVYVGMVGGGTPALFALDGSTGVLRWSTGACCLEQSVAVANDVVYYGSNGGLVHAVNALTGAALWSYNTGTSDSVRSTPAIQSNVLYVGAGNRFFALHTAGVRAGTLRWAATMPAPFGLNDPAVANGTVYAATGSPDSRLYALDTRTGVTRWSAPTEGPLPQGAAVANGVVYYTTSGGNFYAFNATSGAVLATASLGSLSASARTPAVSDGVIYLNDGFGKTHALAPLAGNESAAPVTQRAPDPKTLTPDPSLPVTR